jgi:serine/threonine-protein kinase
LSDAKVVEAAPGDVRSDQVERASEAPPCDTPTPTEPQAIPAPASEARAISTPSSAPRAISPSTPPRSIRPLPGGRPPKLGQYEILGKVAKGGMATIYLARRSDGSLAAVKVVRHEFRHHPHFVEMFVDEGALLASLVHPNIVRTLECGEEDGQRFIAMELLIGHTLLDLWKLCVARSLKLPPEIVAWVGARIADALDFAHSIRDANGTSLDIIHRDVNPSNVFLTYDGSLKLYDFGLAKSAVAEDKGTAPGIVKGKLPYLSPEQIMLLPLDGRCDIFALGTTLWEMVALKPLFLRDSDVDTVKAVRGGPIPDLTTIAPEVPPALAAIIRRALERNRAHRYATARELARDLHAFASLHPSNVPERLSTMLKTLFPEAYARQTGWIRGAQRQPGLKSFFSPSK